MGSLSFDRDSATDENMLVESPESLVEIRNLAMDAAERSKNRFFTHAFKELAMAADRVAAMYARQAFYTDRIGTGKRVVVTQRPDGTFLAELITETGDVVAVGHSESAESALNVVLSPDSIPENQLEFFPLKAEGTD